MQHDDMFFLVDCIIDQIREDEEYEDPHARELTYKYFAEDLGEDHVYIVTYNGVRVGMVACGLTSMSPWDTRVVGSVWMLYVKPEYRKYSSIVSELLITAIGFLSGQNVVEYLIYAKDEHLVEKYKTLFDMRVTGHEYLMKTLKK